VLRRITLILAALTALFSLSACGGSSDAGASPSQSADVKKININIEGNSITPNGDRVNVKIGQPIQFVVTSDSEGEIHVHSDPEKELTYNKGTTVLEVGSFDRAGVIEVESHALDKTIVQLQVQ
jgi:plastocyanin